MFNEDYVKRLVNAYRTEQSIPQEIQSIEPFYRSTSFFETAFGGAVNDQIAYDPTIWYFTTLGIQSASEDSAVHNGFMQFEARPSGAAVSQNFLYNNDVEHVPVTYKSITWKVVSNKGFLWNSLFFQIDKLGTEYRYFNYWLCGYKIILG